jgi:RNA polymerase sigma factor (sigma-70 family)
MFKDYRVTVKVRNNRILRAIESAGGTAGGKWCEANGLSYSVVNDLISLRVSPLTMHGSLSATAEKLCDILGKLPEELWSNDQLYPLEKNFSELEMSHEQVVAMLPNEQQFYLMDTSEMERKQTKKLMDKALETLTAREAKILRMRFEDDLTLEAIGKQLGVTGQRVREMEARALRKMRHPTRVGMFVDVLDREEDERDALKLAAANYEKELKNV